MNSAFLFLLSLMTVALVAECGMPGGLSDVDLNKKDLNATLHFATIKLNHRSNRASISRIYRIDRIQQQVVAGVLYHVSVLMRPTTCVKSEVSDRAHIRSQFNSFCTWFQANFAAEQLEQCEFTNTRSAEKCFFKVWERVWEEPPRSLVDPLCESYTLAEGE